MFFNFLIQLENKFMEIWQRFHFANHILIYIDINL